VEAIRVGDNGRDEKGQFTAGNRIGFPPGVSGYAPGRHDSMLDHLAVLGAEPLPDGKTRNRHLAEGLWQLALSGRSARIRLQAIEVLLDRLHGKPQQSVRVGLGTEQPLTDVELRAEIQAQLVGRGATVEESQRFLAMIEASNESGV
jgi:hypothetical protein